MPFPPAPAGRESGGAEDPPPQASGRDTADGPATSVPASVVPALDRPPVHGPRPAHGSSPGTGAPPAADAPPDSAGTPGTTGTPLRVTTLELFFDLVFAFTLTQLTALLARHLSLAGAAQTLLVFGVLWWMYGGYAWLTNTRRLERSVERLLLLLGMAGFLIVGLAIPAGFRPGGSGDAVALGLGYLVVVVVHASLYFRVNRNILRVAPFNLTSALLVILAGAVGGPFAYALWSAALAIQMLSPLIARPGGRFGLSPAHFVERHGALIIVALGESVAAVGIGAAAQRAGLSLAAAAVLGLALSAALWWTYFGGGDDERAERAMSTADPGRVPGLALSAYFFAHIPMLMGIVVTAAGVTLTIGHAERPHPAGQAITLAAGVALFLAGNAGFRRALAIGRAGPRVTTALFALATTPLGAAVSIEAQLAVLLLAVVVMLVTETYLTPDAPSRGRTRRASAGG